MVYLICLSTGRNYGMGSVRKKELYNSLDERWPIEVVSQLISHYVEALSITTLVTFDRYGVSKHNNHTSIYYAVANLILEGNLPKCCGVYVLDTTNVIRKYWLLLDIPISLLLSRFRYMGGFQDRARIRKAMRRHKSQLVWFRHLYMCFSSVL
ncbi:hypothetical protein JTB14_012767 [Gonioctena quinquepunctata]|nr:hypothetical protein JTB14_012767 [Gonioctena quinquepunctata]